MRRHRLSHDVTNGNDVLRIGAHLDVDVDEASTHQRHTCAGKRYALQRCRQTMHNPLMLPGSATRPALKAYSGERDHSTWSRGLGLVLTLGGYQHSGCARIVADFSQSLISLFDGVLSNQSSHDGPCKAIVRAAFFHFQAVGTVDMAVTANGGHLAHFWPWLPNHR